MGKKRGLVKLQLTGTGVFPLRKKGTERIKEKNLNAASLWFQFAWLDCRAIFWLKITILYLLKVSTLCVCFTLAMHCEAFQFPAFSCFSKMTQKRISVDSVLF